MGYGTQQNHTDGSSRIGNFVDFPVHVASSSDNDIKMQKSCQFIIVEVLIKILSWGAGSIPVGTQDQNLIINVNVL